MPIGSRHDQNLRAFELNARLGDCLRATERSEYSPPPPT
jgi:hypothetical protein